MLFALDIDGTIAVGGNWFARWLAQEAQLAIPEEPPTFKKVPFKVLALPSWRQVDIFLHSFYSGKAITNSPYLSIN